MEWIDPSELDVKGSYRINKDTYLMPSPDPDDPLEALKKVRIIRSGGSFAVLESFRGNTGHWYRVQTIGSGTVTHVGWVKAVALAGQKLEKVK